MNIIRYNLVQVGMKVFRLPLVALSVLMCLSACKKDTPVNSACLLSKLSVPNIPAIIEFEYDNKDRIIAEKFEPGYITHTYTDSNVVSKIFYNEQLYGLATYKTKNDRVISLVGFRKAAETTNFSVSYEYNADGYLIKEISLSSTTFPDHTSVEMDTILYTYANGNLTTETFRWRSLPTNGIGGGTITYDYFLDKANTVPISSALVSPLTGWGFDFPTRIHKYLIIKPNKNLPKRGTEFTDNTSFYDDFIYEFDKEGLITKLSIGDLHTSYSFEYKCR